MYHILVFYKLYTIYYILYIIHYTLQNSGKSNLFHRFRASKGGLVSSTKRHDPRTSTKADNELHTTSGACMGNPSDSPASKLIGLLS